MFYLDKSKYWFDDEPEIIPGGPVIGPEITTWEVGFEINPFGQVAIQARRTMADKRFMSAHFGTATVTALSELAKARGLTRSALLRELVQAGLAHAVARGECPVMPEATRFSKVGRPKRAA